MNHPAALTHDDLSRLTGYSRAADLERWCHEHGIRYFRGRAGIWTTLDAVNLALGIKPGASEPPPARIEF